MTLDRNHDFDNIQNKRHDNWEKKKNKKKNLYIRDYPTLKKNGKKVLYGDQV